MGKHKNFKSDGQVDQVPAYRQQTIPERDVVLSCDPF